MKKNRKDRNRIKRLKLLKRLKPLNNKITAQFDNTDEMNKTI